MTPAHRSALDAVATATDADGAIATLEAAGLGWDVGHTGRLIEARIWCWPFCIGRYRPGLVQPLVDMLRAAAKDALLDQTRDIIG